MKFIFPLNLSSELNLSIVSEEMFKRRTEDCAVIINKASSLQLNSEEQEMLIIILGNYSSGLLGVSESIIAFLEGFCQNFIPERISRIVPTY